MKALPTVLKAAVQPGFHPANERGTYHEHEHQQQHRLLQRFHRHSHPGCGRLDLRGRLRRSHRIPSRPASLRQPQGQPHERSRRRRLRGSDRLDPRGCFRRGGRTPHRRSPLRLPPSPLNRRVSLHQCSGTGEEHLYREIKANHSYLFI